MSSSRPINGAAWRSLRKGVERTVKGLAFHLLRPFFRRGRRPAEILEARPMKRVLLLRPDTKIGDMVASLPLVDALTRVFPHLRVSMMCSPQAAVVIRGDPRFENVFLYRKSIWRDIREVRRIRSCKYDAVMDLIKDDSITALALSQWCTPRGRRISGQKTRFAPYYDVNVCPNEPERRHRIQGLLGLLEAFGVVASDDDGYAPLFLPSASRKRAAQLLHRSDDDPRPCPLIGLNLSAGSLTRLWSDDKAVALVGAVRKQMPDAGVIVLCAPKDRARAERVCHRVGQAGRLIPRGFSITDVSAVISSLDVLVTPDTSVVHIARGFRVPVVGLYPDYDVNIDFWHPYGQPEGVVRSHNPHDISDISEDEVLRAIQRTVRQIGVLKSR